MTREENNRVIAEWLEPDPTPDSYMEELMDAVCKAALQLIATQKEP